MARRQNQKTSTTPTDSSESVTTPTEEAVTMTDTTTETPEVEVTTTEAVEETPEAPKEKKVEKPIDLTEFQAAVAQAMEARDEGTGVVPEGLLSEVTVAYRALEGVKAKNAAKGFINEQLKDAVNNLDMYRGKAYMLISEVLTAGAAAAKEKVPADPTEAHVQRLSTLHLAFSLVTESVPEGVDAEAATEKAAEQVKASIESARSYLAWLQSDAEDKGDEPEVSGFIKSAVKLATGKTAKVGGRTASGTAYTGQRRDIGEHIREAFADQPVGKFLTVAEIRNFKSTEYSPDLPSAGAISARLFPKDSNGNPRPCTLDFVDPGQNEKGNHGATKK